jgi:glucan 1,3-beta-glucosidase
VSAIPDVIKGTDFKDFADVFQGAWQRIQKAVDKAGQYGLGILIDLHCAAGK